MADTPDNPSPPPAPTPPPDSPSNPWAYSGIPAGGFYTPPNSPASPNPTPNAPAAPLPGEPGALPLPGEPTPVPAAFSIPPATPPATPPANPPASAPAPAPRKNPPQDDASLAGVIDTIEAIIIALIVALTFRAFVVEAFVIPTGSMAPTLLGAHYKVICPKCGYEFDLDAGLGRQVSLLKNGPFAGQRGIPPGEDSQAELGSNRGVPLRLDDSNPLVCPNCRYAINNNELPQYLTPVYMPDYRRGGQVQPVDFAWANNGDRILVLKYLYSIMAPKHWDVIVFKEPQWADSNYIKRLIGLPGETIRIVNGDIYIGPPGHSDPADCQISRKPEDIQPALWQLVYDNDFYPTDEGKRRTNPLPGWADPVWTNPWQPDAPHATAWKTGPVLSYAGSDLSTLQFHLLPPGAPPNYPPYGLNTLGYNTDLFVDEYGANEFAPRSIVGDLRLETLWYPTDKDTSITLTLGRPNNCYRLNWGPLGMKLERLVLKQEAADPPDHWIEVPAQTINMPGIGAGPTAMPAPETGKAYHLALNNVDHAVQFYVEGKKVLWFAEPWTAAQAIRDIQRYPADWTNSRTEGPLAWEEQNKARTNTLIQIEVKGACSISHLRLLRDLYYTQVMSNYEQARRHPGAGTQNNPLTLGEDEFFALGDNSRRSSDGRLWEYVYPPLGDLGLREGIVPRRYLLGKAFFVYWPAGFTPLDPKNDLPFNLPLIPDTGDMRMIR